MRHLGHGIGLRTKHYEEITAKRPAIDWLEVISENFMVPGGNPRRILRTIRERYPVVLHGVSLSIGSTDPINRQYLAELKALADEVEPAWVSDHLCWGTFGGKNSHDLLPLPYTQEALLHVVERVDQVQSLLGRTILLENVSSYVTFATSEMPEWTFLREVSRRSGCGVLLDLNNIDVSGHNHGFDPIDYLEGLRGANIGQYHLAGPSEHGDLLIDTHDHPVRRSVWRLYEEALRRFGAKPTLVEWDQNIPSLTRLLTEADKARTREARFLAKQVGARPEAVEKVRRAS